MSIFLPARAVRAARGSLRRSFVVVVAALLVVVAPLSAVLVLVLTRNAEQGLKAGAERALAAQASSTAQRISAYVAERQNDLLVVAYSLGDVNLTGQSVRPALINASPNYSDFPSVSVLDEHGAIVNQSTPDDEIRHVAMAPVDSAARRDGSALGFNAHDGAIGWAVSEQFVNNHGRPSTIVGRLNVATLDTLASDAKLGRTGQVIVVDRHFRKLVDSSIGLIKTDVQQMGHGVLTSTVRNGATVAALAGHTGATRLAGGRHRPDQFAGYAPIAGTGWAIVVAQSASETLAAANHARSLALLILLLGILAAVVMGLLLAYRAVRPIKELRAAAVAVTGGDLGVHVRSRGTTELRETAVAFNGMVTRLSALSDEVTGASTEISAAAADMSSASEELASTAAEQTAAATETSATMEELARTSASIAENVVAVAVKTTETRDALAQADDDMRSSSARTLALAERVDEIGIILELIHDLADQTNLLALNAAIEAARAGEAGRGFSVVADEVRRLAERSKGSAADITKIIAATQAETSASVLAMEKGSKQMSRGLELMDEVTEATDQVHLTTQQQRVATDQVVETMQMVAEATRQSAATTQQIAQSAAGLAALARALQTTANATATSADEEPVEDDDAGDHLEPTSIAALTDTRRLAA